MISLRKIIRIHIITFPVLISCKRIFFSPATVSSSFNSSPTVEITADSICLGFSVNTILLFNSIFVASFVSFLSPSGFGSVRCTSFSSSFPVPLPDFLFTRDLNCFFYVFQTDICCQIFRCPRRDSDCNRIITKTDQILSKCSFCRKNLFSGLDMISIMRQCFLLIFRNHNAHLSYLFGPPCRYQLLSIPFTF